MRCLSVLRRAPMRPAIIGWLVVLASFLSAGAAGAAELQRVRIGLTREAAVAPLLIALASGAFRDQALDPQLTFLANDRAVTAAVAAGKADIGLAGVSAAFYR